MAFITMDFFSIYLNRSVSCNVVVPTDNEMYNHKNMTKPLKTLYLLHGLEGDYTHWVNRTNIQRLAEDNNICIVMPSGDNKFYCDSELSGDYYGKFISQELVDFTRRTFNLSNVREDTSIGGLSMGGFGAIVNGLKNTETFGQIIALSSALIKNRILNSNDDLNNNYFTKIQYQTMFALKNINDFKNSQNDYDFLAESLIKQNKKLPKFYMECGQQDPLYPLNIEYRDKLIALGYDVVWFEKSGGHHWVFWSESIERVIAWLK